jgi:Rrf2 family nitric oxide-sensitive transcriptional repressor
LLYLIGHDRRDERAAEPELPMQLLTYTDYAMRVLLYVGAHPDTTVATSTIARAYGISTDHVAKATKALTRHRVLHATRGVRGGVRLAMRPPEIRVGDVVRLFEGERRAVECLRTPPVRCKIDAVCRLRGVLERAQAAFYAELDRCSLEDLLANRSQLAQLLGPKKSARGRTS